MKLDRMVVRLSALAAVAILVLPLVVDQVSAFGNAAEREGFTPRTTQISARDTDDTATGRSSQQPSDTATIDSGPRVPATARTEGEQTAKAGEAAYASADPPALEPASPDSEVLFASTVAAAKKARAPKWRKTEFRASTTGTFQFGLDWSGKGNLLISLRDLKTNKIITKDTSKASSKSLTADLREGRKYRVAVWAKSGAGTFEVTMTSPIDDAPNAAPDPNPDPAPDPTPPTTSPPDPTPPPETNPVTGSGYPGEPANGKILWGASIQGNGDPVSRHEDAAGHPLTLHRTYFKWSQRSGGMVTTARSDIANGRQPWVSVKTPSWTAMANGDHDAEIDEMLRALDALNGSVWLTIHHEPEGGGGNNSADDPGGPSAHVAMNRRVRERMTALGTDNIALAPILMGWTFNPSSGRNANDWWAPGIYDFLGVDHYQDSQASLLTDNWFRVRSWAAGKGVDIAVGEWGMRGTNAAAGDRVREWYNSAAGSYNDGRGARVIAISAFDSGLNSPTGSWELSGKQLEAFRDLLKDSRTANPS